MKSNSEMLKERSYEETREVAIGLTLATYGLFSPIGLPIIAYTSIRIAQINMPHKQDNQDNIKCKM